MLWLDYNYQQGIIKMWISKKDKDELEGTIADLNERLKQEQQNVKTQIDTDAKVILKLTQQLEKVEAELATIKEKAREEDHQTSTEPWFELVGQSVDPIKGLEFHSDWNPAMIQYLKENGINDKEEDLAIQKFIAFLYQDLIEKFEQRIIDNSDKKTVSDFL